MDKGNCVILKVLRQDSKGDEAPRYQTYAVPLTEEKVSLLQALEEVYSEQDDTLAFRRYSCGVQYCNSCMLLINGKPAHACRTILNPGEEWEVAPLQGRHVLRDLIAEK